MPENQTVELDRASRDLSGMREAEQAAEQTALDLELQQAIDQLRSGDGQQQPEQQPQQEQPQPEPEQQAAQPEQPVLEGENVWQRPEVIEGITAYTNEVGARFQQAEANFAAQLQANAQQATAAIFGVKYPELAGARSQEELIGGINAIAKQNPQRGQEAINDIKTVQQLSAKAQEAQQQIQAQQQQQHRQQFDYVATHADNAFDTWAHGQDSPERVQEVSANARNMLRNDKTTDYSGQSPDRKYYTWRANMRCRSLAPRARPLNQCRLFNDPAVLSSAVQIRNMRCVT